MKKIVCLCSFVLVLASCSSSDSDSPSTSSNLLKKEIVHWGDGGSTTYLFNYNGNKITTITDNEGGNIVYTYTGDNITNIKYYYDGDLEQEDFYVYDGSGKLTEFRMIDEASDWGDKEVYVHNANGTVSVAHYIGDATSQPDLNDSSVITFYPNGEIHTIVTDGGGTRTYTFDDKNNPWKNITGMAKLEVSHGEASGINHNVTLETETYFGETYNYTSTYTYNSDNYPLTVAETFEGTTDTSEFFYE